MRVFTNHVNINVADIAYVDFGCSIKWKYNYVSSLAMSFDMMISLNETLGKIILMFKIKKLKLR